MIIKHNHRNALERANRVGETIKEAWYGEFKRKWLLSERSMEGILDLLHKNKKKKVGSDVKFWLQK